MALLDRAIATLHLSPPLPASNVTHNVLNLGSLVRVFALRAELADRRKESAVRWAQPVASLWQAADASLQPVVLRMAELSKH